MPQGIRVADERKTNPPIYGGFFRFWSRVMAGLYNYRWQKAREGYLRSHPLCAECSRRGYVVQATIVDHKIPHRGNQKLFWDKANWQSLCENCHNSWKQALEKGHLISGADENGMPTDPRHPWCLDGTEASWCAEGSGVNGNGEGG